MLIFAGISRALHNAIDKNIGDNYSLLAILSLTVIFGGLFGWLSFYIFSAMISFTGKWLDGKGDTNTLFRVMSYALFPTILLLFLTLPLIGVYGIELFKSDEDLMATGLLGIIGLMTFAVLQLVLAVCSLVFMVIAVAEVQGFTIGKAVVNILLPILLIVMPLLLILFATTAI